MDNSFDIFVDSAANLTDEMIAKTGINMIPFTYTIDGEQKLCYEKGVPFAENAKKYYEKVAAGAEVKTSLVCADDIIQAVSGSMEQGKDILLTTISAGISGTQAQALKAQEALKERFPERKMFVIDSANASFGEGLLAVHAAEMREAGESLETCAKWISDNVYFMNSYVTVGDLKYLKKSGRVSAITAFAGTLLNIRPLLKADGASPAKLTIYAKERGRKKSVDALIKAYSENAVSSELSTVAIAHGNCEEEAIELADRLKQLGAKDVIIEYYDLCSGAHVGPGTLAIFFMGKDRRAAVAAEKKFGILPIKKTAN